MRCATQRVTLFPLPLFWLCHYQSRITLGPKPLTGEERLPLWSNKDQLTYFSSDSSTISTSTLLGVGAYKLAQPSKRAGRLSVKTKRWLFFLGLSNQRMPIPPLMTPRRKSKNFPMWIERKLGIDIDPSAYPECCVGYKTMVFVFIISRSLEAIFTGTRISSQQLSLR